MKRMTLVGAVLGTVLLAATGAQAQFLAEQGAAMGTHSTLAGTSTGSTCPVRILSDYGNRVAAAEAARQEGRQGWGKGSGRGTGSGGWATANAGGARGGSGWATGGSARNGGGGSGWAKGGSGR
jgi:hypothetical protein